MYRKIVIISSVFLFSGCSNIGEQLGNAVLDGIKAGLAGEPTKTESKAKKEPLLEDEKIWNACMEEKKKDIRDIGTNADKRTQEIGARTLCQRKLGLGFERGIRMQKRRNAPDREQKVKDCITRVTSNLKTEALRPGMEKMCKDTVDFDPHMQCVMENQMKDLDQGHSTVSSSGMPRMEHKKCNHLKGKK
jgi:hypothetical protein